MFWRVSGTPSPEGHPIIFRHAMPLFPPANVGEIFQIPSSPPHYFTHSWPVEEMIELSSLRWTFRFPPESQRCSYYGDFPPFPFPSPGRIFSSNRSVLHRRGPGDRQIRLHVRHLFESFFPSPRVLGFPFRGLGPRRQRSPF